VTKKAINAERARTPNAISHICTYSLSGHSAIAARGERISASGANKKTIARNVIRRYEGLAGLAAWCSGLMWFSRMQDWLDCILLSSQANSNSEYHTPKIHSSRYLATRSDFFHLQTSFRSFLCRLPQRNAVSSVIRARREDARDCNGPQCGCPAADVARRGAYLLSNAKGQRASPRTSPRC
jgi:hypothetical protein